MNSEVTNSAMGEEEVRVEEAVEASVSEQPNENMAASRFLAHLSTYPAVTALVGLGASFPVVQMFASNAVPLLMYLRKRSGKYYEPLEQRAKPAIQRLDQFGDNALTALDKTFPRLKEANPQGSIVAVRETLSGSQSQVGGLITKRVVSPAKSLASRVQKSYSVIYQNDGRALIRGRFDPVLAPLNLRLQSFIDTFIPGENDAQMDNITNELSRTFKLLSIARHRVRPLAAKRVTALRSAPVETLTEIQRRYAEEKEKHPNAAMATIATSTKLGQECVQTANRVITNTFTTNTLQKDSANTTTEAVTESVQANNKASSNPTEIS